MKSVCGHVCGTCSSKMEQELQESVTVDNAVSSQVGLSHRRKVADYE